MSEVVLTFVARRLEAAAVEPVGDVTLLWRALKRLGVGPEAAAPAQAAGLSSSPPVPASGIPWCARPAGGPPMPPGCVRCTGPWPR
jgi:hypothetical protein